ncbi:hypothetical protein OAO01_03300, partial [Oligoflexia bacterium]|nr:hypothetical protein [Oligoflexia bacterium]
ISGNNFQYGRKRGEGSYYYSIYTLIWGWATWRRTWQQYQVDMRDLDEFKKKGKIKTVTANPEEQNYWLSIFDKVKNGEIDTWDYQLMFSVWNQGGLGILPNVNMVSNLGFGEDATHTKCTDSRIARLEVETLDSIIHPPEIKVDKEADAFSFQYHYNQKINDVEYFVHDAMTLLEVGALEEALERLDQAQRVYPETIFLLYPKAIVLGKLGRTEDAIAELERFLSGYPNHVDAKKMLEELKKLSEEHERQGASDVMSLNTVAELGTTQVRRSEADQLIDQALAKIKQNHPQEALSLLIEAKNTEIPVQELDYARALLFLKLNRLSEAKAALEEELAHFPNNTDAKELLVHVSHAQKL